MILNIGTGYFANTKRWTKVHFVWNNTGKPICGCNIGNDLSYQWCSPRPNLEYVECKHCERKAQELTLENLSR